MEAEKRNMRRALAVIHGGVHSPAPVQLSTTHKPKLLDQVHHVIRMLHYSPKTEESYVHWIKRFIFFHNKRHPAEMSEKEISCFLSSLASEAQVSASTQNQALNAILFLLPHAAPFVCHPLTGGRLRYSHRPRTVGTQRCRHHDDLHPRTQSGRQGSEESRGSIRN